MDPLGLDPWYEELGRGVLHVTWGAATTAIGFVIDFLNFNSETVNYNEYAIERVGGWMGWVSENVFHGKGAITIPPYIFGSSKRFYNPKVVVWDPVGQRWIPITWHEGGHIIEGMMFGPIYLLIPLDYLLEWSLEDNVAEIVANALAPSLPEPEEQGSSQTGDACNGT